MKIYVDFDDCLCETARYFSELVDAMFGLEIPYEQIEFFDLQKSFSLTDAEYEKMMTMAHKPEALLSYDETPGASETVNHWIDLGYDVSVITGRPYSSYKASRLWLDRHGLERVKLYHLNKYGRDTFYDAGDTSLSLEDYYKMHFDYAVEDSPKAFKFFDHLPDLQVLVYDRPWNQNYVLPEKGYRRCYDWETIRASVRE
jgi:hypothetical protein